MFAIPLIVLIMIALGTLCLDNLALLIGMVVVFMLVFGFWMISAGYPMILLFFNSGTYHLRNLLTKGNGSCERLKFNDSPPLSFRYSVVD